MKRKRYLILMADVIESRHAEQIELMESFKAIVSEINIRKKAHILSPLTITLGDEFQGVVRNFSAALEVIVQIEEMIIAHRASFKLRYVLQEGEIETPINRKNAYEMLGSGLTDARENLNMLKRTNDRFLLILDDEPLSIATTNAFRVYQGIVDDWQPDKDYEIVAQFLALGDYKAVADELGKDRSLMWRREKTARIKEYQALKKIIAYLGNSCHV